MHARARLCCWTLCVWAAFAAQGPPAAWADPQPAPLNYVVLVTDDQRFDSLWAMPLVQQELVARGVVFEQAFVTTPLCCPFRASFLSGGFQAKRTGVLDNTQPNGGVARFDDTVTLARSLQAAGFATALVGKYLNDYEALAPYVPPGWTTWVGAMGLPMLPIAYVLGTSGAAPGSGAISGVVTQYPTDYLRDRALDFLDAHASGPFFLYVAFGAPHLPATPAPGDESLFPAYLHRDRAWNEPDPSDKPQRVQLAQSQYLAIAAAEDAAHRDQLRSLQAVDRAVRDLVDRLASLGVLDRTVIVLTSDNGYLWGEHGLVGKTESYEESIRVPLVVVRPGVAPRTDGRLVAVDLDVPATIAELAGLPPAGDGASLVPLLENPALPGRAETLIEQALPSRVWSGLRVRESGGDWKYVEDSRGDVELYDLVADPYEEQNLASSPAHAAVRADFAARLAPQKGLAITSHQLPPAEVGAPYAFTPARWGGTAPFTWSVAAGELPPGIVLDPATGTLSGTPTQRGVWSALLRVEDASAESVSNGPQRYDAWLPLAARSACENGADDDADGLADAADPGCNGPPDPSERSPLLACDDGADGDGDGLVDLADPGCASPAGATESPACNDGADNDGDGLVDLADPACAAASGASEEATPACSDALDNDGDGLVDGSDPGCASPADAEETSALACDNGLDDDGDGASDGADPVCGSPLGVREDAQCQDGADNDGDGRIDFDGGASRNGGIPLAEADSFCTSAARNHEARPCGLGVESLGALWLLRRRDRAARPRNGTDAASAGPRAPA